jgi:SAM-dependent methyltransferase
MVFFCSPEVFVQPMNAMSNEPRMLGSRDSHFLMRRLLADIPPGRALDAATGYGALAAFLHKRDFEVQCCDIDGGLFEAGDLPLDLVDLNGPLPYADATFDLVTCANAIHRLYNVDGAIREFARILKPGGHLLLAFNNYSNISKRIRFLLYGSLTNKTNEGRFVQTIDAPAAHLRQALFFPQVYHSLKQTGLMVDTVCSTKPRLGCMLLTPLAVLIRLYTTIAPVHKRDSNCIREMNSWSLLPGGKHLVIIASKPKS